MINIKFPHTSYDVKSELSELSLKEYETIQSIMNGDGDYFEKFMLILNNLGIPMCDVEEMDVDSLVEFIKTFTNSESTSVFIKNIEIEGYNYIGVEQEETYPKFTPRTIRFIEKSMKNNPNKYFGEILAIFFKREDLSNKEHYEDAHIKHKANLFRNHFTAEQAMPYIFFAAEKLLLNIKKISEYSK